MCSVLREIFDTGFKQENSSKLIKEHLSKLFQRMRDLNCLKMVKHQLGSASSNTESRFTQNEQNLTLEMLN